MNEANIRYFICPLLPKDKIQKLNGSMAANNFCYNLISGNGFSNIIPFLPVGYIDQADLTYDDDRIKLFYSSWRKMPLIRKFAFIQENIMIFREIQQPSSVWFYNLPYTTIILFILLKLFKPSVNCNLIMLDFTPKRKGIRGISDSIEIACINRMDGMIKLAESDLFKVENAECLPGVVPYEVNKYPKIENVGHTFLISGVLEEQISMLTMLLRAFAEMPEFTLHITGKAPDEKLLEQFTGQHKNIIYHGMVEYEEYLHILHQTTFVLSTRNPNYPENQCNFPSKIIESLLHNRIVISTISYPQLKDILYFKVQDNVNGFISDINHIVAKPNNELCSYANQAEKVISMFNVKVWNEYMTKIETR